MMRVGSTSTLLKSADVSTTLLALLLLPLQSMWLVCLQPMRVVCLQLCLQPMWLLQSLALVALVLLPTMNQLMGMTGTTSDTSYSCLPLQ